MKNSDKLEQDTKYSAALKEATTLYSLKSNKLGCRKVAALMSAKYNLERRTVNYRTLIKYTAKGLVEKPLLIYTLASPTFHLRTPTKER
jgi:hypothetical protein